MPADRPALAVGTAIGPHYVVERQLGAGGMGVVYQARDTRLNRSVALKVLPAEFTADEQYQGRFDREARAASALNHPNIVTIHEIGHAEGIHYITQEWVDGETLRQRLRRGRLPIREAIDIAIQVGSALAAAHAAGVVHRDIKPENIMLRPDGLVKVVDFGLAKLSRPMDADNITVTDLHTAPGAVMGTVRYMSPEQARGLPVDHRSDIFSLGVVLYEMLAGHAPFDGPTPTDMTVAILEQDPPPIHALSSAGSAQGDGARCALAKMLRKNPAERYQSAGDLVVDLKASNTGVDGTTVSRRRWPVAAALVLALVAVGAFVAVRIGNRRPAFTGDVKLLLADFSNTTGDAVFDGRTLRQALAIQFQQTPFIHLFPDEGLRGALTMMTRPQDERVTREIALEVAERQSLDAVVAGTIARLGRNYVITLEAIGTPSGESLATAQGQAADQEHVLEVLGQAAADMRQKLGESLATLERFNTPIQKATSSSLEALKAYSAAQEQLQREDGRAALPFYLRAIELDPNLVAAYDSAAWAYAMSGQGGRSGAVAAEGYRRRDSATELEKLSMATTYHHFATGDRDEEDKLLAVAARLYPNEWGAFAGLAMNHTAAGRYDEAIGAAKEVLRVSPGIAQGYRFLAPALLRLGRFDEALNVIEEARSRQLDNVFNRQAEIQILFAKGDAQAFSQALERIRQHEGERQVALWRARAAAFDGRWRESRELYLQTQPAGAGAAPARAAALPAEALGTQASIGFCRVDEGNLALAPARLTSAAGTYISMLATDGSLCGDLDAAEQFAGELAKRFPQSTLTKGVSLPLVRAATALKRDQPDQAIDALRNVGQNGGAGFLPYYLRGQAYLRLERSGEAANEFRAILEHRGWGPMSISYQLAHVGLARALAMAGDVAASRKEYEAFFTAWQNADSDLPVLIDARQAFTQLK